MGQWTRGNEMRAMIVVASVLLSVVTGECCAEVRRFDQPEPVAIWLVQIVQDWEDALREQGMDPADFGITEEMLEKMLEKSESSPPDKQVVAFGRNLERLTSKIQISARP